VRDIVILGSTGSIGVQALELVAANPELFRVVGLSAGSNNLPLLFEQARNFRIPVVGTTASRDAWSELAGDVAVIDGPSASTEIAAISCDIVLNAITGSIGLGPTLFPQGQHYGLSPIAQNGSKPCRACHWRDHCQSP
jgi:1-deoxy-D-xylulose-5-phosphate reductoisomerase